MFKLCLLTALIDITVELPSAGLPNSSCPRELVIHTGKLASYVSSVVT
jgi:hypothetical protein